MIYMSNIVTTILGLLILIIIAILAIDSNIFDLISLIPTSIVGACLFITGYIGINLQSFNK